MSVEGEEKATENRALWNPYRKLAGPWGEMRVTLWRTIVKEWLNKEEENRERRLTEANRRQNFKKSMVHCVEESCFQFFTSPFSLFLNMWHLLPCWFGKYTVIWHAWTWSWSLPPSLSHPSVTYRMTKIEPLMPLEGCMILLYTVNIFLVLQYVSLKSAQSYYLHLYWVCIMCWLLNIDFILY